jgi:hypothetical protein
MTTHNADGETRHPESTNEEAHMSTNADNRLDEMRDRIDRLQASARNVEAKVQQLESSLKSVDHAVAAELAENRQAFADAIHAHREDLKPKKSQ